VEFVPLTYTFSRRADIPFRVTMPPGGATLTSTMSGYSPPGGISGFDDTELGNLRHPLEYALDVGAYLQADFCNQNLDLAVGNLQVVLKQTAFQGAYSLWYTNPMALVCHPNYLLNGPPDVSSLYHEMGHNLSLNSPAQFRLGGKIDGDMNAIVSETLAQIFQHATAYVVLNHPTKYGIAEELVSTLRSKAVKAFGVTARAYRDFVDAGCPYSTYNAPGGDDETFGTFMTVAFKFVEKAEAIGDFRTPTKRMMALLQTFREADRVRYQEAPNEAFRASLLVAALSYGFNLDLRAEFRAMNFPVSDAIYAELMGRMGG
jgi:hypothetical protein